MRLEGECRSFTQACDEIVGFVDTSLEQRLARLVHHAVPLASDRWREWVYTDDIKFVNVNNAGDVSDLLCDDDVGLRRLAADPCTLLNVPRLGGGATVVNIRFANPGLAGKKYVRFAQAMTIEHQTIVLRSGIDRRDFYAFGVGRPWQNVTIGQSSRAIRGFDADAFLRVAFMSSYRMTMRYEWQIGIGRQDGGSVLIPIDRAGCSEAFRLRDIPEGKSRRTALRHFVESHLRRRPGSEEWAGDVEVRRHLRGETKFLWNGLRVELFLFRYDVDDLASDKAS